MVLMYFFFHFSHSLEMNKVENVMFRKNIIYDINNNCICVKIFNKSLPSSQQKTLICFTDEKEIIHEFLVVKIVTTLGKNGSNVELRPRSVRVRTPATLLHSLSWQNDSNAELRPQSEGVRTPATLVHSLS